MSKGIVLSGEDQTITARATRSSLAVEVCSGYPLMFDKTLFVEPKTQIPWDLLPAAWHFLEHWDAAVPLWRYGVTAADVGTANEQKTTKAIVRDLRVLLHSYELLFVRKNNAGSALIQSWLQECQNGADKRLAFLRALSRVKPRVCVLPISWLADVREDSRQALYRSGRYHNWSPGPLVKVELEPGRFVKCHPGDEDKVREHFEQQRAARHAEGR